MGGSSILTIGIIKALNLFENIHVLKESEQINEHWLTYEVAFNHSLNDGTAKLFVNQTFQYMILETFEAAKKYSESEGLFTDFQSQDFYPRILIFLSFL